MHRTVALLLILGLVAGALWTVAPVAAQDGENYCANPNLSPFMAYGDSLEGSIDDNDYFAMFCFEGRAGDTVDIRVSRTSGNLDTLIGLFYADSSDLLIDNDDLSSSNRNSRIQYTLPRDTTYMIFVTRYDVEDGDTVGAFIINLEGQSKATDTTPTPTPTFAVPDNNTENGTPIPSDPGEDEALNLCESPNAQDIAVDTSRTGTITDDNFALPFCFTAAAGDAVEISAQATSGDLDTLILVTDESLSEVFAQNDDITIGESDSALVFNVPADGRYVIIVTRFEERDGLTTGDFIVTLSGELTSITTTDFGGFGFDLSNVMNAGNNATPDPTPVNTLNFCDDPIIAELAVGTWQSLSGGSLSYDFACDGTVLAANLDGERLGTFALQGGVLTMQIGNERIIWNDLIVVEGFLSGTDGAGSTVYFATSGD